jgi:hypothetical protein
VLFQKKSRDIADAFSKHFQSVFSSYCSGTFSPVNQCTEILSLVPISISDVQYAIKWLLPLKLVRLDEVPSSVIKGCSEISVPVLRFY